MRKLKAAAVGKRLNLQAPFRLLFGVAMLCATAMSAQTGKANPDGQQVMQQASMLSFNDTWVFILVVFLAVSPTILLLRKPGAAAAPMDAH